MAEKDILKSSRMRLDWWERLGVVIHHDRVNSGKIQVNGRWIQMAKSGTPDLIAYINKENSIWVCFFECKAKENSIVQESQKDFQFKWRFIKNVTYDLVYNPIIIDRRIEAITGYSDSKLNSLPKEL